MQARRQEQLPGRQNHGRFESIGPKVDGRHTHLIPAAIELIGRWGEGMVLLFKKMVALATREGRNEGGYFATLWKRRISIVARTAMITQAHYALRKQDQDDMSDF